MDVVRVAAIGCGRQATRNIQVNLPRIPQFDFVATCDLAEDLARRNARSFGAQRWYTDARLLLEKEQLDAAIVVGPPELHAQMGREVALAGLHVFTEKPVSDTLDEGAALVEAVERAGKFGQVGHMQRHADTIRMAKRITERLSFGAVTFVESKYHCPGPWTTVGRIPTVLRTFNLYQTSHAVDLARHFGGEVRRLTALQRAGAEGGHAFAITLEFAGGAIGWVNVNSCVPTMRTRLEVSGANKEFVGVDDLSELQYAPRETHDGWPSSYAGNVLSTWRPGPLTTGHARAGYFNQLEHFAQSILAGTPPIPSIRDGYEAVRCCFAIEESLARRGAVDL
ncbi:MAG: Gfo/Idh/MocA family oxidoreductase [Actinobacteria bacterium]|nr:Gfo/Idh/MocA family oxidoreductase [Actinomycetota bacterium]